ncbi:MAG TPA: hypothetical protein VEH57_04650 [Thermoplasmata archaeon]|nr:hypothetical protein [Thermoplasmata archaeon]
MSAPPASGNLPWCPNCKQPLSLNDVGTFKGPGGFTSFGLNVIFCRKCGVVLGGSST